MRRRTVVLLAVSVPAALVVGAAPAVAHPGSHPPSVSVLGAVAAPAAYTEAQLAALPQTTLPDTRSHTGTVSGVLVEDLVTASAPVLPDVKNALLRVTVTISGAHGRAVAAALGELDPSFGNHPALLALAANGHRLRSGPELVFPADRGHRRTVRGVARIRVSVVAATVPSGQPAGSVVVVAGTAARCRPPRWLGCGPGR